MILCGASPHALMNAGTHTVLINIDLNPSFQMFEESFRIILTSNKAVSFVGAMRLKRHWGRSEVSLFVGAKTNFCAKVSIKQF